jgi:predicted transcriptional regulator YheO
MVAINYYMVAYKYLPMEKQSHPHALAAKWAPVVECVADLLGHHAEVVLHDVSHPEHSVILIRNGHVTGRSIGAPLTDLGFFMLRESERKIETLGVYQSHTETGKVLRCNAANLRDDQGRIEAILCINIEVTGQAEEARAGKLPFNEHYQTNIDQVIRSMIGEAARNGVAELSAQQKVEITRALENRGVFLARGAVEQVAKVLKIAPSTVYKYVQKARASRMPRTRSAAWIGAAQSEGRSKRS